MGLTYEEMMKLRYNKNKCVEAFRELVKNPRGENEVIRVLEVSLPVLGCVLNSQFKRLQPGTEEYDEIISSVPCSFYQYLMTNRFYERFYDNPDSQFSYLFGLFRYEVLNILKKIRKHNKFEMDTPNSPVMAMNLDSSYHAVEYKIFFKQLGKYMFTEFEKSLRFSDIENDICRTIAQNFIFNNVSFVPMSLLVQMRGELKVGSDYESKFKFFGDFTKCRLMMIILDNKDMIDMLPSIIDVETMYSSDHTVQDVFLEGMHTGREPEFWMGVDGTDEFSKQHRISKVNSEGWHART